VTSGDDGSDRSGAARAGGAGESSAGEGRAGAVDGPSPAPGLNGRRPELPETPAADDGPDPDDQPVWVRHRPPIYLQPRVILAVLLVVLVIGAVALGSRRGGFPPKAQCQHPTIAAGSSHLRTGYPLYWAITGPDTRYAVTFGASRVTLVAGKVSITGTESMAGRKAKVVQQPAALTGCRRIAHFAMPFPLGEYHLRMWRVTGGQLRLVALARVDSDG
jgi:hypothetical protein